MNTDSNNCILCTWMIEGDDAYLKSSAGVKDIKYLCFDCANLIERHQDKLQDALRALEFDKRSLS